MISDFTRRFGKNINDTGTTAVQVANLTMRINNLSQHLIENKHDYHSKNGLRKLISRRSKLLHYLHKKNEEQYLDIKKELRIRR